MKKKGGSVVPKPDGGAYRLVFSSDSGTVQYCKVCNGALPDCSCKAPKDIKLSLESAFVRYEKKGRGGKDVTMLMRLPADDKFLKELCKHLKQALGTGGTSYLEDGQGIVEIQGDRRERIMALAQAFLSKK